jgi:hypothetical protein
LRSSSRSPWGRYAIENRVPADPTEPPRRICGSSRPPRTPCARSCRPRKLSVLPGPLAYSVRVRDACLLSNPPLPASEKDHWTSKQRTATRHPVPKIASQGAEASDNSGATAPGHQRLHRRGWRNRLHSRRHRDSPPRHHCRSPPPLPRQPEHSPFLLSHRLLSPRSTVQWSLSDSRSG